MVSAIAGVGGIGKTMTPSIGHDYAVFFLKCLNGILPHTVINGETVQEDDGVALSVIFVIQPDVAEVGVWHLSEAALKSVLPETKWIR